MADLVLAPGSALGPVVHGHPLTVERQDADAARLAAAAQLLGHRFARPELLAEAMTHRSAARRTPGGRRGSGSNERLEFIGDRVLGLLMAEWLIERYPHEQEGDLGRRLANLVAMPVLAAIAVRVGLAAVLSVSPGEERAGIKTRATVLADGIEAAIGALYMDGGLDPARAFLRASWEPTLLAQPQPPRDAKTSLQEWAQARNHELPRYRLASRTGPPHAPVFVITVHVDGKAGPVGQADGTATNKREAERLAAEALLAAMGGA